MPAGGAGGFGGGGGGGGGFPAAGGFGGGGAWDDEGGFGGGGGAFRNGGFGAGNGAYSGGGGGLGAGADIFVMAGASLTIGSGEVEAGVVTGGRAGLGYEYAYTGQNLGNGLFIQGGETLAFNPGAGNTTTVAGVIADEKGSANALTSGQGGYGDDHLPSGGLRLDSGTLTLSADNTYTGATTVAGGTLIVNGSIANSTVTVDSGATFGGKASAGAVTVDAGGIFSPGDPSTITVASLALNSGAKFDEDIGGTSPETGSASGYDQTVVQSGGTVSLGSATLNLSLVDGFTPSHGDVFTVINNETADPVNGILCRPAGRRDL